ncbi:type II secretion system protein GspK [Methylobacterium sp. WL19]|uniref:general secretion pathway protein GspK n=1 Tax=Methylobacterium sp. WL19 TaxID=2603896 RepID=UPI0011CB43FE|nr:type II secretion system protein GspK [Methylobacterium sp. WL19]TXN22783.1 general secretion pathway protein GspK [Methylobacterium sp. WL19]
MHRADRQGFVLVAVIGILSLIAALTGSALLALRSSVESVALADEEVALSGLAHAGMSLTAYRLLLEQKPAETLSGQSLPLPGGRFVASIRDEAGLVDLNGSKPELLASVYQASGASGMSPDTFVARLVAWRDEAKGQEEAGKGGSERGGKRPASGRPLRSLDEAASILGLSPRDVRALAHFVTVYNPDGKVNVLSASRAVLEALPGIARPTLEDILARRRNPAPGDVAALKSSLGALGDGIKTEPGPAYRVGITARGRTARTKSVSAVIASGNAELAPFHILEWSE